MAANGETKTYEPSNVAWEKMDKNNNVYLNVRLKDGSWIRLFRNLKRSAAAPHWVELPVQGQDGLPENPGGNFPSSSDIPF